MKTLVKVICIILLLFNGIGALYGGFLLITDPSGSKLQMPLSYLEHSPFQDYLIPGIVLFIVNGIFSFITVVAVFLRNPYSHWLVILQGILLSGWITMQILFVQFFYAPLHGTFLFLGICLIGCGIFLWKNK
jgi:hypothetical protein